MRTSVLKRLLTAFLAVCLTFGTVAPTMVYASGENSDNTAVGEANKSQSVDENLDNENENLDNENENLDNEDENLDNENENLDNEDENLDNEDENLDNEDENLDNEDENLDNEDENLDNEDENLDNENENLDNKDDNQEEADDSNGDIDALAEDEDDEIESQNQEELEVKDYATFLENLKVLEGYADTYAATNTAKDAGEYLLNFIRTGVDRYNDGNWKTLAGEELTGFTTYVEQQDEQNNTTVMCLRNIVIDDFKLPNGNLVDFGHMFGTMNIAYIASQGSADLGGWAGDICDLLYYAKNHGDVPAGTVDEMAVYILDNCFGVDAENAFGMDDFYGDMDAIYLMDQMKAGKTLSAEMEAYFTETLSDRDRSEYFMKNRFENLYTKESVREAVYNAYIGNVGISVLESGRDLSGETDLRQACCYAFADFVYAQAGDTLEEPTEPDPEEPEDPSEPEDPEVPEENPYFTVFSSTTSNLAPGIVQTIKYANSADDKQMVYYLAEVDVTREDVTIRAGYRDADPAKGWGMQRVEDQANAMNAKYGNPESENYIDNFRVIVATNGAGFNMGTGKPGGLLVMDGVEWSPVDSGGFFAILKDGRAMIGTTADYAVYKDQIQEAIAGFGSVLIKDGEIVAKNDGGRASRTAIGIKANGSVVMMVLDGRQEPFSCGGTMAEIAQIMLEAGCVEAINLDGGGSTTFVAKPEGSDTLQVINRPSDGYQRSVSTSLMAVSTAKNSKEFSYANITSEYDYLTVGTSLELTAVGVSESGSSAPIPEDAFWAVSDETIGTVVDGVFTAAANGDVDVKLMLGEEVLGKKVLHVVVPTDIAFKEATMNVIYGVPVELPVLLYYNDNPVAYNDNDVMVAMSNADAGTVEGRIYTATDEYKVRSATAYAVLMPTGEKFAMMDLVAYQEDEVAFDFDHATSGNRTLAWNREVTNAITGDGKLYQIETVGEDMELNYTFAMDMTTIEIPKQLSDLTYMLPGADQGKTAWDFLLSLAERVGELTHVTITVQMDADLDVDISELKISNDMFYLRDAKLDDNNLLTIVAGWHDQTQAIDPSSANPTCVLSGLKATPKDGAEGKLEICNTGLVGYKIFLRSSSLYGFANQEANQAQYGLKPYSGNQEEFYLNGQPLVYNGGPEQGAYFENTYSDFEDSFVLNNSMRQGWHVYDDQLFYYVDNEAVTGIQRLPGYEDPSVQLLYSFDENGACSNTVTGMVELDGMHYYAINGVSKTGWRPVTGDNGVVNYYYFDPSNGGAAVDGQQTIGGYTYTFEDCKLIKGQLVTDSVGTRYRWAGQWAKQEWLVIDGKEAYAQQGGYFMKGLWKRYYKDNNLYYFAFGEDGFWMKDYSGLYDYEGKTYLIKNGIVVEYPGLVKVGDDYYYFASTNTMVKDCSYWFSKPNGLIPNGRYTIGADGKVQMPADFVDPDSPVTPPVDPDTPVTPDPDAPVLNGIVKESDGVWYYYVNGVKTYAGLILIDGDYYYVNSKCQVIHGCDYWISKNNGYMVNKMYTFDAEGKIVLENPEEKPSQPDQPSQPEEKLNGIVKDGDTWYYYVDGVKTYAGLILIDGDYYYVNSKCQVMHDCEYWISKNNGYMVNKMYTFDADGKIVLDGTEEKPSQPDQPSVPGEKLNGIVKDGDNWYYYVDGVKTYAGLILIDGDYYYVDSKCMVKHDCTYWISKNNGITSNGSYTFDSEGKMVLKGTTLEPLPPEPEQPEEKLNGIVKDGDNWYYYVDGTKTYAGLIIIDGYYYYVDSKCMVKHDCTYWISKNNGYMKNGSYTFDAEGRMVNVRP